MEQWTYVRKDRKRVALWVNTKSTSPSFVFNMMIGQEESDVYDHTQGSHLFERCVWFSASCDAWKVNTSQYLPRGANKHVDTAEIEMA